MGKLVSLTLSALHHCYHAEMSPASKKHPIWVVWVCSALQLIPFLLCLGKMLHSEPTENVFLTMKQHFETTCSVLFWRREEAG